MKKYFYAFLIALIIGFFLCNLFLKQYDDYKGIKVASIGEELYFIEYGSFPNLKIMEENTISLENYIYSIVDGLYYVYIGITNNEKVKNKIIDYYKKLGYKVSVRNFFVSNKEFLKKLEEYDNLILESNDSMVISSLIGQVLTKYEEVVLNDS